MPVQTGVRAEQAEDADLQPPPRALAEDAGLHIDPVHLVQVGLDQRPLGEQLIPGQAGERP